MNTAGDLHSEIRERIGGKYDAIFLLQPLLFAASPVTEVKPKPQKKTVKSKAISKKSGNELFFPSNYLSGVKVIWSSTCVLC